MKLAYFLLLTPLLAFADDPAAAPVPFAWLTNFLTNAISHIPVGGAVTALVAIVLEAALRLAKTDKPRSICYAVSKVFHLLGDFFTKVGALLDSVIPQRTVQVKVTGVAGPTLDGPQ